MSYTTQVNLATNPELEKLFQNRSDLKTGDKLEGEVVKFTDDGKAVIDFGNFKAEVNVDLPLEKGDIIKVVVQETGKRLKLKIEKIESSQQRDAAKSAVDLMREADVSRGKSIDDLYSRINRLLDKEIKTLESSENTPDNTPAKILEQVGKELAQLKEYLQVREAQEPLPKEVQQEVEKLLEKVETAVKEIPRSQGPETSARLENLAKAVRDLRNAVDSVRDVRELQDRIVKDISRMTAQVEELPEKMPLRKEIQEVVKTLSEMSEKIQQLKLPQESREFERLVKEELSPKLQELRELSAKAEKLAGSERNSETSSETSAAAPVKEIQQQVRNLENAIGINVDKAPQIPRDINVIIKTVELVLDTDLTPTESPKETAPVGSRILSDVRPPEDLHREIDLELVRLRQAMEPLPQSEPMPPEVRARMAQVMEQVDVALDELPAAYKLDTSKSDVSRQMEILYKDIRTLRSSLDQVKDFAELKETVLKEITRLQTMAQDLDLPDRKAIDAVLGKLADAAEKITNLEKPEQAAELTRIITEEVKPNLQVLSQTFEQSVDSPQTQRFTAQTKLAQRDLDAALQKMLQMSGAEFSVQAADISTQVEKVDISLTRLNQLVQLAEATPDTAPEVPQFSESVQTIYENIKSALRMLKQNLQISGNQLEIPEEVSTIFQNLQSDLKAAEAVESVLNQLTKLKSMIQQADLPIEKVVSEIMESLDEMIAKITELNKQREFGQIRQLVQKQLGPELKMMGDIFGNQKLLNVLEGREQTFAVAIRSGVMELQQGIEKAFSQTAAQSGELTELTQIVDKLASLSGGRTGNEGSTETIANLSQNIEQLLARMGDAPEGSVLSGKIKGLLTSLQNHFEPLDISHDALKLVPRLKALVSDSGMFFEKKLGDVISKLSEATTRIQDVQNISQLPEIRSILDNDMKPNLLELKELLNKQETASLVKEGGALDAVRRAVDDLLTNIGNQQEKAVDQQAQQQNPVQAFTFHLPIKDEENAELKVFYNKGRKKEDPEEYKLSLFLEMSKLGGVRTDFMHVRDDLSITFFVEHQKIRDYFLENLHEVQDALDPVFDNLHFNIMVSKAKVAEFESDEPSVQIISDKEVDVKI